MLEHQSKLDYVSPNLVGADADWSSRQAENQHEFQTKSFLFQDGHVEIVNKFYCAPPMMPICWQQTYTHDASADVHPVSQQLIEFSGGVDS